jgi:O-antigen/teichoic acid export membrane protein
MTRAGRAMRTDLDEGAGAMARGAATNLGGAFATNVLSFVLLLVTTHVIAVGSVGLLTVATTVITLALVPAVLGLDTGSVRFVARAAAVGDERAARGACQSAVGVVAVVSTALAIALFVGADRIAALVHKPAAVGLIQISVLGLPGLAVSRVALAASQGFGVMSYAAWFGALKVASNLVFAVLFVAAGLGVHGLAIAATVAAWVVCAASLVVLVRIHPLAARPAPEAWQTGPMLRFSLPQTLSGMLFFTILWTDTLLLARYGTAKEVGVYAVAGRLLVPAIVVSTAIGQMFAPRIAAADARGAHDNLARMLKRVTYWNTAVSLPLFAMLAVVAAPLLRLFGPRYTAGATALVILAIGQLLNTAAGPLGQVINMSGRPYVNLANNTAVAALNVVGCMVLIPRFGITGAACSTSGALTLVNAIKLVEVRFFFDMSPFRADSVRAFAAAGLAAAVTVPVLLLPHWPPGPAEALVACAVLLLAYSQFALWFALRGEERETFQHGWSLMRAKVWGRA